MNILKDLRARFDLFTMAAGDRQAMAEVLALVNLFGPAIADAAKRDRISAKVAFAAALINGAHQLDQKPISAEDIQIAADLLRELGFMSGGA